MQLMVVLLKEQRWQWSEVFPCPFFLQQSVIQQTHFEFLPWPGIDVVKTDRRPPSLGKPDREKKTAIPWVCCHGDIMQSMMEVSQKSAYISLRCGVRESFQKEVDDSCLQVFPPAVPTYGTRTPQPRRNPSVCDCPEPDTVSPNRCSINFEG